mgnify:CR=1 FL=1
MKKEYGYPTLKVICQASAGNETAIREILKFYDAYICKLCLRPFYHSESGKIIMQVDEELKGQIHTEMMKAILKTKDKDHDDFYFWIVREVLPVLKNEDQVKLQENIEQKIKLLAQGDVLLSERVGKIETKVEILEDELPLFAYDIEEIQEHAVRHIKQLLGEKYKDNSLRAKTYINLYKKIEEEFNVYCYKGLARKKLADVHEFIDCYKGVEYEERK